MNDSEVQLFALMEVAKEQQHSVNTALAALDKQHAMLMKTTLALSAIIDQQLLGAAKQAASTGAAQAVKAELEQASHTAVAAVADTCKPLLAAMSNITRNAEQAEEKLKGAVSWFGWRWGLLATAIGFGVILAMMLSAWSLIWWQRAQLDDIKTEKERLDDAVAMAQQTLDMLNSKTGGVRYVEAKDGRILYFEKGYEPVTCKNKVPCIQLK